MVKIHYYENHKFLPLVPMRFHLTVGPTLSGLYYIAYIDFIIPLNCEEQSS